MKAIYSFLKTNLAIIFSLIILVSAVVIFLGSFFNTFNGEVSTDQSDWGNFGSYISGTVGVLAACLAVIWLMMSVHLQKVELNNLKAQLAESENEQKKQTHIGALSAVLNSSVQSLAQYQNVLIALNNGEKHLHPMDDRISVHFRMEEEWRKMTFYQKKWSNILRKNIRRKSQAN